MNSLKEKGVSTMKLEFNGKAYTMGLVKDFEANVTLTDPTDDNYKKITFYNGHSQSTKLINSISSDNEKGSPKDALPVDEFHWQDGTKDLFKNKLNLDKPTSEFTMLEEHYNLEFKEGLKYTEEKDKNEFLKEGSFTKAFLDFQEKWENGIFGDVENGDEFQDAIIDFLKYRKAHFKINDVEEPKVWLLYPIITNDIEA